MEITKIKKYEITFNHVDESINVDWINGSPYKKDHIIADTLEEAIGYVKAISNEIKNMHIIKENYECNILLNLISNKEDDFKTSDRDGYWQFHLKTPSFMTEYGNKAYCIAVGIQIKPFVEMKLKIK